MSHRAILLVAFVLAACETPTVPAGDTSAPTGPQLALSSGLLAFDLVPGTQTLSFSTGGEPPLDNLRFLFVSPHEEIKIYQIRGVDGPYEITWNPPGATAREASQFFATEWAYWRRFPGQRPTNATEFEIVVTNISDDVLDLRIRAFWF